jgi:hypothetical protein
METQFEPCPYCSGTGSIRTEDAAALVVTRALEEEAVKGRAISLTAHVPERTAVHLLNQKRDVLLIMEEQYGCQIAIRIETNLMPDDYRIEYVKGQPLLRPMAENAGPKLPTIDLEAEKAADEAAIIAAGGYDALAEEMLEPQQARAPRGGDRSEPSEKSDRPNRSDRSDRSGRQKNRLNNATDNTNNNGNSGENFGENSGENLGENSSENLAENSGENTDGTTTTRRRQRFEKWRERRNQWREPKLDDNGNPVVLADEQTHDLRPPREPREFREPRESREPREPRTPKSVPHVRRDIPIQMLDENGNPILVEQTEGERKPHSRNRRGGRNRSRRPDNRNDNRSDNRGDNTTDNRGDGRAPRRNGDSVARLTSNTAADFKPAKTADNTAASNDQAKTNTKKRSWWQRLVE